MWRSLLYQLLFVCQRTASNLPHLGTSSRNELSNTALPLSLHSGAGLARAHERIVGFLLRHRRQRWMVEAGLWVRDATSTPSFRVPFLVLLATGNSVASTCYGSVSDTGRRGEHSILYSPRWSRLVLRFETRVSSPRSTITKCKYNTAPFLVLWASWYRRCML
jgi:hypothetical protein